MFSLDFVLSLWTSDPPFIAIIIPLIVAFVAWRMFDLPSLGMNHTSHQGPFSLQAAYHSYLNYTHLSMHELHLMEKSYTRPGLTRSERRLSHSIGYPEKLNRLRETIKINSKVTNAIARLARLEFPNSEFMAAEGWATPMDLSPGCGDLNKLRESLKHFVRDWSEEGCYEREVIFQPILEVLMDSLANGTMGSAKPTVLVPGCGLGRLAWEISEIGYDVTALELSYFQTLALRFLLSSEFTSQSSQHLLYPYAYWFSHQRSTDNLFREVHFPDALPRLQPGKFRLVEEDFMKHCPRRPTSQLPNERFWLQHSSSPQDGSYDYIVTLFFIDTSPNVLATLTQIHKLLKPGGTWINLGPLLWIGGAQARFELSLDEVLKVSEEIGFEFLDVAGGAGRTRTVECEYTADRRAMMKWIYQAEFWVAKKEKVL